MTFLDLLGMALRFFPFFGLELVKTVAQNTLPASAKKALGIGPKPTFEDDLLDLSGRVVFVTGGNVGLGRESIRVLAKRGATVYMASRTRQKALDAIDALKVEVPGAKIYYIEMDLASLASVRKAAEEFLSKESQLHILLNNAGVMALPPTKTVDGFDVQWGTNHVGHFLLTNLLLPTLLRTAETSPVGTVRIVNVSSLGHRAAPPGGIDFKDPNAVEWNWARYGQSKLANILHAKALAKKFGEKGIIAVSVHPGMIDTNLHIPVTGDNPINKFIVKHSSGIIMRPIKVGAVTQLWACASPELTMADNGSYYHPYHTKTNPSPAGQDEALAEKLWDYTEEVLKQKGY